MITVTGLTKKYNNIPVLDNISFKVNKGSIVGVIGPNGAGKSTLISIIASIIKPSSGKVTIDGGKIGYVPQEITLFPSLTTKENLNFWDTISNKHSTKTRKENIARVTQIANLEDSLHKNISQLSGGLKRRVNIAVSLLSYPEILIMDEPTVGMDINSRTEMVDFIKNLSSNGTTIIYVSHHPDEIQRLCSHIICLNKGQLVFDGTMNQLKSLYPSHDMYDIIYNITNLDMTSKGGGNAVSSTNQK